MARVRLGQQTVLDAWDIAPGDGSALVPGGDWVTGTGGTAAEILRGHGRWSFSSPERFDANDWWFRCRFDGPSLDAHSAAFLCFGGLATVCEVWLNGVSILKSDSMFVSHELEISSMVQPQNELVLRFFALDPLLRAKKPRPRWRTRLVDQQTLRFVRTTLLGRVPGWSPPVAPVGPFRPVTLEVRHGVAGLSLEVKSTLQGTTGQVSAKASARLLGGETLQRASLIVGDQRAPLTVEGSSFSGTLTMPTVKPWWPHTHGEPTLYPAALELDVGARTHRIELDPIGFRTIEVASPDSDFTLRINGEPVFMRGACWTGTDVISLSANANEVERTLEVVVDSGMNMVRSSGVFYYETDAFFAACDRKGVLVWQDFMFANMDYPHADAAFVASVEREANDFLSRVQNRASLAVLCGGSEVEQQAAMMGLPRDQWSSPIFSSVLKDASARWRPDVPYWPSSPSGGPLPFSIDAGVSHYYGVGAYLRPLEDARRAGVRFTSECLAFSNVPNERTFEHFLQSGQTPCHHPAWKARIPRDNATSWDFEDVRDDYLERLFKVDARELRSHQLERYLALSRVVTGEAMLATLSEWRRPRSGCHGALIWLLRDLWPGAGWGLIDATGLEKAAYWYVRRASKPLTLLMTDEGLNGLDCHALNDTQRPREAVVKVRLFRHGETVVETGQRTIALPARSGLTVRASELFDHFVDSTYAYRFGAPGHDLVVATLDDAQTNERLGEAFHFPHGLGTEQLADLGLTAEAQPVADGSFTVRLTSKHFAQSVAIEAVGFRASDDYFHLVPGEHKTVVLKPVSSEVKTLNARLQPLNCTQATKVTVRPS